jgi:cyclase
MLKVRVIPTLLWKNVGLVKGVGFDSWRRVGTILPAVKVYNSRQVDEMIVVDITATEEGRVPDFDTIREFSSECFVPLTIGGGVRDLSVIRELLRAGADKVCINSALYDDPALVRAAAERFGSQCIVASIDARREADGTLRCHSRSGKRPEAGSPAERAREAEGLGAGEILVTSIDRDGTMAGYDIELVRSVAEAVSIPVIASGGAGNYDHFLEAVRDGKASAVAAASVFHYTEQTPMGVKEHLSRHGVPVRDVNACTLGAT